MAMSIAICDDKETYHRVLTYINEYVEKTGQEMEVFRASSGKWLLEHLSEVSVIMMDIQMPDMDGIAFGKEAWERGFCGKIIMLSGTVERFKEAFMIEVFRFVTKPIEKRELLQAVADCVEAQIGYRQYEVYQKRKRCMILEKEICFIQSLGGDSEIWGEKGVFRSPNTLKKWETCLDKSLFVRTHKQNIVNISYIDEIGKDIVLTTGERVLLSRRNTKRIKEMVMNLKRKGCGFEK